MLVVSAAFIAVESLLLSDFFDKEKVMLEAPMFPNRLLGVSLPPPPPPSPPATTADDDPKIKLGVLPEADDDDEPNPEGFPPVPTPAKPPPPPKPEDPFPVDEAEVAAPKPEVDPKPKTFLAVVPASVGISVEEEVSTVEANGLLLSLAFAAGAVDVDANKLLPLPNVAAAFLSVEETDISAAPEPFVAMASAVFGAANVRLTLKILRFEMTSFEARLKPCFSFSSFSESSSSASSYPSLVIW